ncbi:hypothetical protein AB0I53_43825 [Saccharopolyspora sp. NPDC050389]|uniref:hypothetical protein n=1 Tax=Saccharopolyspora sp. NPDC050389 TaxID=3155516 RepID=UPI003405003F
MHGIVEGREVAVGRAKLFTDRGRAWTSDPSQVDVDSLGRDLRAEVDAEVRFDAGTRGAYSTDASNYRQRRHHPRQAHRAARPRPYPPPG